MNVPLSAVEGGGVGVRKEGRDEGMERGWRKACGNHDGGESTTDNLLSLSLITYINRFDHHIVLREEIKEDRRRQRAEARLEAARRGDEAAVTEERKK